MYGPLQEHHYALEAQTWPDCFFLISL